MQSLPTQQDLLVHTRALLASPHFGSHAPARISPDCWLLLARTRILVHEYLDQCGHKEPNTQLLYEHVNSNFFHACEQFDVLDIRALAKTCDFFEAILIPIIEHYAREWHSLSNCITLANLVSAVKEQASECLCPPSCAMEHSISNSRFCYRCGQLYHKACFGVKPGEHYECPACFLAYSLPDRQVLQVIFKAYLPPVMEGESLMSIIDIEWPLARLCLPGHSIELRCCRVGDQYEMAWPQTCDIYLDDEISVSFKPLPENSPLKRRHDNHIIVPVRDLSCSEKIRIHEHYSGVTAWHLLTVSLVKQRNEREIFNSILRDPGQTMEEGESKQYLQTLFWKSSSLEMEQLRISDKCQFYRERIRHPCRSRHCSTHYQPFDLYSLICSSVRAKSSVKRWKCPICGARAYDIVRDLHLDKLMNQAPHGKEMSFLCQGEGNMAVEREGNRV